nr:MAG TPA: hypothetical protein [Caudoviricetes sp.]
MNLGLLDRVHDRSLDIDGIIVDQYTDDKGRMWFVVEGSIPVRTDKEYCPVEWPLYDCEPENLDLIE